MSSTVNGVLRQKKNRIFYVGGFGLPHRTASGQRALDNASFFEKLGYQVTVLGKIEPTNEFEAQEKVNCARLEGIDCFDIRHPDNRYTYPSYVYTSDTVEHVIHSHGVNTAFAIIAYNYPGWGLQKLHRFAKNNNIKMVAECTEWYGIEGSNLVTKIQRFLFTEYRMRYVAKQIGNIICAGLFLQDYFSDFHTMVLPWAADTSAAKWHTSLKLKRKSSTRRFIYAGSPGVGMSKDHIHQLVEGFAQVKEKGYSFEFVVVGITKDQFLQTLPGYTNLVENLGPSICFLGRLSHEQTLEQVRLSDFFVFLRPNNRVSNAGFPTKLVEAFCCGVPVITNDTSDIGLYVHSGRNGFLLQGSTSTELALVLERSLQMSDAEVQDMGIICLEENPFHYLNFAEATQQFLDHLR